MCGTGHLLNKIAQHRKDLRCFGCSLTPKYINYAKNNYKNIQIDLCDAQKYQPLFKPDIVICTAGLHHLPWNSQSLFLNKIASELTSGKILIVGEELIRPFNDEKERRLSVIEINTAILKYMTGKKAPSNILNTATDVLKADLNSIEYKIDKATLENMLSTNFTIENQIRFWPENEQEFGDYVFICSRR
jgi:trans-aconitate methyltransferase